MPPPIPPIPPHPPPIPLSSLDYMDKVVTLLENHPDVGLTNRGSNLNFGEENFTVSFVSYISQVFPGTVFSTHMYMGHGFTS